MKLTLRLLLPCALALVAMGAPARAGGLAVSYAQRFGDATLSLGYGHGKGHGYGHAKGHGKINTFGLTYRRYSAHAPAKTWVAGCWKTVEQQVWVPGACERVWIDPVYRTCYDACGRPYRVLVSAGHWQTVERPGHYETKLVQVFEPGHWVSATAIVCG